MMYWKLSQKKRALDRCRPLPSALVRNLEHWFNVELTYTSNGIEGHGCLRDWRDAMPQERDDRRQPTAPT